jgi:hypothetical protein
MSVPRPKAVGETSMSSSFLITGLRMPAALDWVRRLGRSGHRVAAADSLEWPMGRTSRYLSRYVTLPSPRVDSRAYALAVRTAAEDFGAEWILPNSEEIFYLAGHRGMFDGRARLLAEPLGTLELLHHKGRFARFTRTLTDSPIQAPQTHEFESRADLQAFADGCCGRSLDGWVLKAAFSRFSSDVHICPPREVIGQLEPTPENPWLAQRFEAGLPVCSYSLASHGRITAHAAYLPKHTFRGGTGYFFEPIERPDLLVFVESVVRRLNFTGQISFDFIVGDGRVSVIECNPRATSGLFLLDSRDPLPFLTGEARGGWPMNPWPRMMLGGMLLAPGRLGRIRDFLRATDVVFDPDDFQGLRPRLRQLRELATRSKALGNGYDLLASAREDCEWNGEPMT